jgi:hypothetical protein
VQLRDRQAAAGRVGVGEYAATDARNANFFREVAQGRRIGWEPLAPTTGPGRGKRWLGHIKPLVGMRMASTKGPTVHTDKLLAHLSNISTDVSGQDSAAFACWATHGRSRPLGARTSQGRSQPGHKC